MLSKSESAYLRNPQSVNPNYAYVLEHRIRAKVAAFQEEMSLLNSAGITENCKNLTDFRKIPSSFISGEITVNQGSFNRSIAEIGAFGGIWTRDHYLTKVTPHRTRLRRQILVLLSNNMRY